MSPTANEFATIAAADLRAVEHATDALLGQMAQLMTTLAAGRIAAGLAAAAGQGAIAKLNAAAGSLIAARGEVVDAHRLLARDAHRLGLAWIVLGPGETKPTEPDIDGLPPKGALVRQG